MCQIGLDKIFKRRNEKNFERNKKYLSSKKSCVFERKSFIIEIVSFWTKKSINSVLNYILNLRYEIIAIMYKSLNFLTVRPISFWAYLKKSYIKMV